MKTNSFYGFTDSIKQPRKAKVENTLFSANRDENLIHLIVKAIISFEFISHSFFKLWDSIYGRIFCISCSDGGNC